MRLSFEVPLHDDGPALWPAGVPLSMLEQAHRDLGTPRYETLYQGRKGGLSGRFIRRSWFTYGLAPRLSTPFMYVDPAISKKTAADETAIAVGNVTADGSLYLRWIWHGKNTAFETAATIYKAWQYYKPVAVGLEDVAFQSSVIEIVLDQHPDVPMEPVRPEGDKTTRHLGLAALYEFGRIVHHPSLRASAYEHQITRLPGAKNDDMADAACGLTVIGGVTSGGVLIGDRPEGMI